MAWPLCLLLFVFLLGSHFVGWVSAHQETGEWRCESESEIRVLADYRPGLVTLDGLADDWKDIDGFEFPLRPALDPHQDHEYTGGKMTVKVLLK